MFHRVHAPAFRRTLPRVAVLALALVAGLASTSSALTVSEETQPYPAGYVEPQKRNAALVYWQAWSMISYAAGDKIQTIDWAAMQNVRRIEDLPATVPGPTSPEAGATMSAIEFLGRASHMNVCNFEIPHEEGALVLMPHLSKWRLGGRLLRYHARMAWLTGKPDLAAECLGTMVRSCRHIVTDGVIISGLVGAAVSQHGMDEMVVFAQSGTMTAAARDAMLAELSKYEGPDPIGMGRGIATERDVFLNWIAKNYTGKDAGKKLADELLQLSEQSNDTAARQKIVGMDGAALAAACAKARAGYEAMIQAYQSPDPTAAIAKVEERVKAGEFSEIFTLLAPSVMKIRESDNKFRAAIASTKKALSEATLAPASTK